MNYTENLDNIQTMLNNYPSSEMVETALNAILTSFREDNNYQYEMSVFVAKQHIAHTKNLIKDLKEHNPKVDMLNTYDYSYKGSWKRNLKILKRSTNDFSHYPDIKKPITVKQVDHLIDLAREKIIPKIIKDNRENQIDNQAIDER